MKLDGDSNLEIVETARGWLVVDGGVPICKTHRSKGEALSAAIAISRSRCGIASMKVATPTLQGAA